MRGAPLGRQEVQQPRAAQEERLLGQSALAVGAVDLMPAELVTRFRESWLTLERAQLQGHGHCAAVEQMSKCYTTCQLTMAVYWGLRGRCAQAGQALATLSQEHQIS